MKTLKRVFREYRIMIVFAYFGLVFAAVALDQSFGPSPSESQKFCGDVYSGLSSAHRCSENYRLCKKMGKEGDEFDDCLIRLNSDLD